MFSSDCLFALSSSAQNICRKSAWLSLTTKNLHYNNNNKKEVKYLLSKGMNTTPDWVRKSNNWPCPYSWSLCIFCTLYIHRWSQPILQKLLPVTPMEQYSSSKKVILKFLEPPKYSCNMFKPLIHTSIFHQPIQSLITFTPVPYHLKVFLVLALNLGGTHTHNFRSRN